MHRSSLLALALPLSMMAAQLSLTGSALAQPVPAPTPTPYPSGGPTLQVPGATPAPPAPTTAAPPPAGPAPTAPGGSAAPSPPPPASPPPPSYYPPPPGGQPGAAPPPYPSPIGPSGQPGQPGQPGTPTSGPLPPGAVAPPPGYPPPPPGYAYYPQAPAYTPPPRSSGSVSPRRGYHLHDGFYLRLGLGVAAPSGSIKTPATSTSQEGVVSLTGETANAKYGGPGGAFDLAIGGTVTRGLAIAFNMSVRTLGSANVKFEKGQIQQDIFDDMSFTHVGVMADWYTDPRKGLHVQGGVGVAQANHPGRRIAPNGAATSATDSTQASYSGLGLHLGVGYDTWVSDNWSIGGLLRIDTGDMSSDGKSTTTPQNTTITVFAPSLLFTGTYN